MKRQPMSIMVGLALLLGLTVQTPPIPGLGGSSATPSASPVASPAVTPVAAAGNVVRVEIIDDRYTPRSVRVAPGTTIRWVNRDGVAHTVSAFEGEFDSGTMRGGGVFSATFDTPGTYSYGCDLHLEMRGSVIVAGS